MQTRTDAFDTDLAELSEQAKALSHPARMAILRFLAQQDTCICGEIVDELPLAQASVSRHLKVLREAGLINVTTHGLTSCYCVNVAAVRSVRERLDLFFDEVVERGQAKPC
jgi:DNA-binding transcriptional ArsR family regulator